MTDGTNGPKEIVPRSTPVERLADVAAVVTSVVPWIGGPVSAILSGVSFGRKVDRVREALAEFAAELKSFESDVSKEYVQTEDFQELFERTLRQVADERSDQKRGIYAQFLAGAVKSPGEPYDEQLRFLRTLEEMQPDHLRVIKALSLPAEGGSGFTGSPIQTLKNRLPDMEDDRISDLVSRLNDMRVTSLTSLRSMMTYRGSQELRGSITAYGQRFLEYLSSDGT